MLHAAHFVRSRSKACIIHRIVAREDFGCRDTERGEVTLVRFTADEGCIELLHNLGVYTA